MSRRFLSDSTSVSRFAKGSHNVDGFFLDSMASKSPDANLSQTILAFHAAPLAAPNPRGSQRGSAGNARPLGGGGAGDSDELQRASSGVGPGGQRHPDGVHGQDRHP